jgi:hypothetical protein
MPEAAEKTIRAGELQGWKKLRRVAELLKHLHEMGCHRDKSGNRELHFDDYVLLILLYLFNPLIERKGLPSAFDEDLGEGGRDARGSRAAGDQAISAGRFQRELPGIRAGRHLLHDAQPAHWEKPSKWHVTLMALYLDGLASEQDVARELNRLDNTGAKLRAKDEL